ncbi:MAG: sigma-54 dependent transcriptional regulator [bacterium]
MKKPVLLIVDDDRNTRVGLEKALRRKYDVILAESGETALTLLGESAVDVLLSDLRMPGMNGMILLQRALARTPQPVCVLMTAYGTIETAVEAMRRGAADYVTKPYNLDDLEIRLDKALRSRQIEAENVRLQEQLDSRYGLESIIGESEAMHRVYDMIRQAAPTNATVLLQGESGTGKELVAHAIHQLSPRSKNPFVAVHCAALSPTIIESELFGHEKGAFTGASERRIGRFEMADSGTFFLDEVSEIPQSTQAKLLRVLEERQFERVGGGKAVDVDIRLVAATNKNLRTLVESGAFRNDLFFRLDVVNISLPPLRERTGDIAILARHFLKVISAENSKEVTDIASETMSILSAYKWPGNVRELRNAVQKMVVFARGSRLLPKDVPAEIRDAVGAPAETLEKAGSAARLFSGSMEDAEKAMIDAALKACDGNISKAAKRLDISRRTLHRKLKIRESPGAEGSEGAPA